MLGILVFSLCFIIFVGKRRKVKNHPNPSKIGGKLAKYGDWTEKKKSSQEGSRHIPDSIPHKAEAH